ncbi:MAG: SDR family oxidoreductase [Alphaproteobacteria bacterium]|nr:SDR family oxidoreductase [Alphaproteobacteria bacterium]
MSNSLPERFRLDGRVALVTGAARGIGKAIADGYAAAGATVVAADVAPGLEGVTLDVRDERAVEAAVADVTRRHGRIDVLVNNAGVVGRTASEEMPLELWERIVAVNMTGVFLCSRAAGRAMLKQGSGAIVNIASIMGMVGGGLYPNLAYHATKGAVVNMTRALACEWSGRGVRVNAIAPTFVETELTQRLFADRPMLERIEELTPMGRVATAEEIADAALYLASDAAAMVTGHILAVDGGWLAR